MTPSPDQPETNLDLPVVLGGDFTLDIPNRSLHRGGETVKLTPKPFDTLEYLVRHRNRAVPKAELMREFWEEFQDSNTVLQAVSEVRRALGDSPEQGRYIRTVPGRGYRFVADVRQAVTVCAAGGPPQQAEISARGNGGGPGFGTRRGLLTAAGIAAAGAAAAAFFRLRPANPARADVTGNSLAAWDAAGNLLWKHAFAETLHEPTGHQNRPRGRWITVADLAGNGTRQVVFAASFIRPDGQDSPDRDEVLCFSAQGTILWRYEPKLSLTFGRDRFSGPWNITDIMGPVEGHGGNVWVALAHWSWRPGAVIAIDAGGNADVRFVNGGHLYSLARVSRGAERFIIAGGVNNEYRGASLAVLREEGPPARSPQTEGSRYECVGGPRGDPHRYVVLPPTELNAAADRPYNRVASMEVADGRCTVTTEETGGKGTRPAAQAMYGLSADLEVQDVTYDNDFAVQHRRFEEQGRVRHALAACPLLNGPARVRRWDKTSGWSVVDVPLRRGVGPDVPL